VPEEPDVTVFISYRRIDTSADAGRLYDALRRRLGRDKLFMDVDSINPGQDWVEAVEDAVGKSDILLALIGSAWSDIRDPDGTRRLDDEFDRVRLEIEAALNAEKAVIPVLFEDARMPLAADLPETLRPLVRRHAIRISHETFSADLRGLLRAFRIIARSKSVEPRAIPIKPAATPTYGEEPPSVPRQPAPAPPFASTNATPGAWSPPTLPTQPAPPSTAPNREMSPPIPASLDPSSSSLPYVWTAEPQYTVRPHPRPSGEGRRIAFFILLGVVVAVVLLIVIGSLAGPAR
jgi:hypothetical protein